MTGRITTHVDGAPVQPGDIVRIVAAVDQNVYDVSAGVGMVGRVAYLNYDCGCGQSYPADPMIGVEFGDAAEEFWREEVEAAQ